MSKPRGMAAHPRTGTVNLASPRRLDPGRPLQSKSRHRSAWPRLLIRPASSAAAHRRGRAQLVEAEIRGRGVQWPESAVAEQQLQPRGFEDAMRAVSAMRVIRLTALPTRYFARWKRSRQLREFDAVNPRVGAQPAAQQTRRTLVTEAGDALWMFVVQREACGLRDSRASCATTTCRAANSRTSLGAVAS